ncbi:ImmA/IrrE family metallo-endopeptidase [Mycolicibacterium vaccae]|uniref:ImmA/IrrE family metallo-endopeptidase n=1 Tax=Mycolicibacterium vaccae TaxID=1810 RepID=UPI003CF069BA
MDVIVGGVATQIDRRVFEALLEDSVASNYVAYGRALAQGRIAFSDLIQLSRYGEIPYSLFFAPLPLVQAQITAKTEKLLAGLTKQTFSVNSRDVVRLRDVELILKDLLRKQELLKKHDESLTKNLIVGMLAKPGKSVESDAKKLMSALGLTCAEMQSVLDRDAMLAHLITHLEANQILVSQSASTVMPQRLKVKFSGMAIKDYKVPYIFLAGGDPGDNQEPSGRRVFTLTLLAVLVARRIFAPVTYDGSSTGENVGREYDIAAEILMPAASMKTERLTSLSDVKALADKFKVTPSAITVRAMRLNMVGGAIARTYLDELAEEYARRNKPKLRSPLPVNAVRRYNGREFSLRMLGALDSQKLSKKEFCRSVCLNHIKPSQIEDFRAALA